MKCGSAFGIKEFGEGPKPNEPGFINKRIKCLEQARVASLELPIALEAQWERLKQAYAQECPKRYKNSTGTLFLKKIQLLIVERGVHYLNHLEVKEKLTPNCEILGGTSEEV